MRSIRLMAGATVVAASLLSFPALAQDAQKLYDSFKEATAKVKAISYTGKTIVAPGGRFPVPDLSGKVIMTADLKDRMDFRGKFILTGQRPGATPDAEPGRFEIGFDGKVIRNVLHAEKVVEEVKVESEEPVPYFQEPMMLLAFPYWHDDDEFQAPSSVKHAGQAEIAGVKCDILIVERVYDMPSMEDDEGEDAQPKPPTKMTVSTRLHVGEDDHLLRQYEQSEPNSTTYSFGVSLADLKLDPPIEASAFTVKTPEGYEVREVKMDDMMGGPKPKFKVGDVAGEWALKDADGKEHKLSDFKGKVVVMDFWATWCGPCKMAMPGLQKLHEKLKDKGVVVVGVNMADDPAEAAKYMQKKKFTYLGLYNGDPVAEAYGVGPIPQFYVIGVDGKVIHHAIGFDPAGEKKLEEIIEKHLDEQSKH
ncbi:MAG: redoxin domain-containing protein [Phycisphaerales bacterium]